MSTFQRVVLTLVIIGAINWGLIGLFQFDLVASVFGGQSAPISRVVFAIVGISGLFCAGMLFSPMENKDTNRVRSTPPGRVNYGTEFSDEPSIMSNPEQSERNE